MRRLVVLGLLISSSACGVIHSAQREPEAPVTLPNKFASGLSTSSVAQGRWWNSFADPGLDQAMTQMFAGNLSLARGFARLDQAQAIRSGASAASFPQITYDTRVTYSRSLFNFGGGGPGGGMGGTFANEQSQFQASVGVSYEVDLWGRVYSLRNAADYDLAANRADLEALSMSLSAQLSEVWYQLAEQMALEALLEEQLKTNDEQRELVELRFDNSLATAVDVYQQRQIVAGSRAQLPGVRARRALLENQLAVLLGKVPGSEIPKPTVEMPELSNVGSAGVPSGLLQNRPDVRAAQLRVVAADFRIGAAIADRFPAIRLSGDVGTRSFDFVDMFQNWFWNLLAGLTGPLFDGGRRAAEVDRSRAVLEDQLAAYGETVLTAIREVEDALVQIHHQEVLLGELTKQLELTTSLWTEARQRYLDGLSDYLPVLTALTAKQRLEQQMLAAQRQRVSLRVQLHRALGGTWMKDVERPKPVAGRGSPS